MARPRQPAPRAHRKTPGQPRAGLRTATRPRAAAAPGARARCAWADGHDLYEPYHDHVWGVPVHDDETLFEFLVLCGAQAGLSWAAVLRKRTAYQRAFEGFDPRRVARFSEARVKKLLADPGIIRNAQKIRSAIRNARAVLKVQQECGSLDAYLWRFVGGRPIVNAWGSIAQIPPRSRESDALSADLKRRGFSFAGSTICYAFMQTVGMVNDHLRGCFRCPGARTSRSRR
jgi:DNA-3-methyladenine glycosylase I